MAPRRVNSFFICPFVEVHDGGAVNRIRDALDPGLRDVGFGGADYGPRAYLPRLTIGYYNQDGDGAIVRDVLRGIRQRDLGAIQLTQPSLIRAPWSEGMYHLEPLEEFHLA